MKGREKEDVYEDVSIDCDIRGCQSSVDGDSGLPRCYDVSIVNTF
jgi:hypothetical protein